MNPPLASEWKRSPWRIVRFVWVGLKFALPRKDFCPPPKKKLIYEQILSFGLHKSCYLTWKGRDLKKNWGGGGSICPRPFPHATLLQGCAPPPTFSKIILFPKYSENFLFSLYFPDLTHSFSVFLNKLFYPPPRAGGWVQKEEYTSLRTFNNHDTCCLNTPDVGSLQVSFIPLRYTVRNISDSTVFR